MKKIYILLLTLLISSTSFSQGTIDFDTEANWNTTSTSYGDWEYSDSDANFLAVGISVLKNGISDQDGFPAGFGTSSVRLKNTSTSSLTMTVASGGVADFTFQVRRWDGSPATNFSVETTTDGSNWSLSSTIDGALTSDSDWKTVNGTVNSPNSNVGVRIISNGSTERIMVDNFTWTGFSTTCGVALGAATVTCNANTVGDNNDSVTINIPYTGSDATITFVNTTSGGTVGGDDPASVADGTITITGLLEGDNWGLALGGGSCSAITASGSVPVAECDPTPTTCYDLSAGSDSFELVDVVLNSSGDGWSNTSGTYNLNPYCGSGCAGDVEAWLVFGPLDTTQTADLNLALTTTKQYGDTQLGVAYTTSYSGCPSSTTWTTATTIAASGNIDVDLSAANGANVFIGISYIDDGTYSNWTLSNIALESFDTCPPLGTVPTSNCAVCDLSLQTESYVCLTNTVGNGNDGATVEIAYTGVEDTITSITTASGGSIAGDDPATVTDGTITITGLSEGAVWDLTINGGDCDGTTVSGTIPLSVCDPVTTNLVINEILADPGSTDGDANGDSVISTTNDEFVEIYNTGTSALDISGYTLRDITSVRHTFPNPTILQPGTFLTVFGGGSIDSFTGNAQLASGGSLGLNNGGDTVTIKNAVGVVVTTVAYTGASDQSLCREPDFTGDFVGHLSHTAHAVTFSPGAMNDGTFSVNSLNNASFNLYPNPAKSGFINITSTGLGAIQANVFDILGKQVINATVANGRLDVSPLNTGVYIVKLTQGSATTTKKLIIQ